MKNVIVKQTKITDKQLVAIEQKYNGRIQRITFKNDYILVVLF